MTTSQSTRNIRSINPDDVDGAIDVISDHVLDENAESRRPIVDRAAAPQDETAGGAVAVDGDDVLGCMIYTLHGGEPLGEHLARPIPHTPTEDYAIIRYAYLRREAMGNGLGTAMMEYLLGDELRQRPDPPTAVYVEAWHRPDSLDFRPLLEKYDFDVVFCSDDYWAHPDYEGRDDTCPDCNVRLSDCECGAGIYRRQLIE